jgi:hypothetical protein
MYREMARSDLVFMAVIADLADSNTVGETKADLDELYRSEGSRRADKARVTGEIYSRLK